MTLICDWEKCLLLATLDKQTLLVPILQHEPNQKWNHKCWSWTSFLVSTSVLYTVHKMISFLHLLSIFPLTQKAPSDFRFRKKFIRKLASGSETPLEKHPSKFWDPQQCTATQLHQYPARTLLWAKRVNRLYFCQYIGKRLDSSEKVLESHKKSEKASSSSTDSKVSVK